MWPVERAASPLACVTGSSLRQVVLAREGGRFHRMEASTEEGGGPGAGVVLVLVPPLIIVLIVKVHATSVCTCIKQNKTEARDLSASSRTTATTC